MAKKPKLDDKEVLKDLLDLDVLNAKSYYIRSGIDILDTFVAGEKFVDHTKIGFPVAKIIGLSGDNGVGKSTLMMEVCKRICKQKMKVLYVDIERGLNIKSLEAYGLLEYAAYNPRIDEETNKAKISEMKLDCLNEFLEGKKLFYSISPRSYNQTMRVIRYVFEKNKKIPIKLLVIDSIKDAMASSVLNNEDEVEDKQMMVNAKAQEDFLIKLKNFITYQECACVIINQLRTKSKGMFMVLDEAGGQAWLHRCDIRFMLKSRVAIIKKVKNNLGDIVDKKIGNWIDIEVRKGRFGNAFSKLSLPLLFGKGVSLIMLYHKILEINDKITKHGGGIYEFKLSDIKIEDKVKGLDNVIKLIKDNFFDIEKYIIEKQLLRVEEDLEEDKQESEEQIVVNSIVVPTDSEDSVDIVEDIAEV